MSTNETNTYSQAKDVFNRLNLFDTDVITLNTSNNKSLAIFRKHLGEMIKRKNSDKRFTTTSLNNNQIEVIRIK